MEFFMDILSDTLDNVNRGCVNRRWPIIMRHLGWVARASSKEVEDIFCAVEAVT